MKTVLITGAAGGIGRAMCSAFRQAGYRVVGLDRTPMSASDDCEPLTFDLTRLIDPVAGAWLATELEHRLNGALEALVNNAATQIVKPLDQLTMADWNESLQVNLLAPFRLAQMLSPVLQMSRGAIVNVASIHAQVTKAGFAAYSTTKGALVSLTRAQALELAPGVRVNAILPAAIDTAMLRDGFGGDEQALQSLGACHPMGRIGYPEEIAAAAVWLCSRECRFLTGEAIRVDGGIGALLHDPILMTA